MLNTEPLTPKNKGERETTEKKLVTSVIAPRCSDSHHNFATRSILQFFASNLYFSEEVFGNWVLHPPRMTLGSDRTAAEDLDLGLRGMAQSLRELAALSRTQVRFPEPPVR